MPFPLEDLSAAIDPTKTTLLLGAGSSIPSGAPSAKELSAALASAMNKPELSGAELADVAGIFELNRDRRSLVEFIANKLARLQPTGGLLNLPRYGWQAIYTTNYDTLVEQSYKKANKELFVIRGNAEFRESGTAATPLLKVHGCVTQDTSLGSQCRMVITESDYQEYEKYREIIFDRLSYDMMKNDVLIIGHSLADENIKALVNRVLQVKSRRSAPGKVYFLAFEKNVDRALLLEQRGMRVAFGGLDELMDCLWDRAPAVAHILSVSDDPISSTSRLSARVTDVGHAMTLAADPIRMFNGRAGSYAEISAGFCFARSLSNRIVDDLADGRYRIASIVGPAGVGKTTACRLIAAGLGRRGFSAWEHRFDTYLDSREWINVAEKLKKSERNGVLFVDECHREMREVNSLCDHVGNDKNARLRIVVNSPSAQWRPRIKSKYYFTAGIGQYFWLDRLDNEEVHNLLQVVDSIPQVRTMVQRSFQHQPYQRRFEQLRKRCSSDMFVCLKNIFATQSIDDILLKEFAELSEPLQDVYRHVAVMEALNVKAHRQLILRCTSLAASAVAGILDDLKGIVEEYDINDDMGLYGWETRHQLIAQLIAQYKFADQSELEQLIGRVIENLNPSIGIELRSAIGMCDRDYGIGRLSSREAQNRFYRQLIDLVPNERVPRHRLIGNLFNLDGSVRPRC